MKSLFICLVLAVFSTVCKANFYCKIDSIKGGYLKRDSLGTIISGGILDENGLCVNNFYVDSNKLICHYYFPKTKIVQYEYVFLLKDSFSFFLPEILEEWFWETLLIKKEFSTDSKILRKEYYNLIYDFNYKEIRSVIAKRTTIDGKKEKTNWYHFDGKKTSLINSN